MSDLAALDLGAYMRAADPAEGVASLLLGAALMRGSGALPDVDARGFAPGHTGRLQTLLYGAMRSLGADGEPIDLSTVPARLKRDGALTEVTDLLPPGQNLLQYLHQLFTIGGSTQMTPEQLAEQLRQAEADRDKRTRMRAAAAMLNSDGDPGDIVRTVLETLKPVADGAAAGGHGLRSARGGQFVQSYEPVEPVLDAIPATGRGRVVTVTGPTGHGKTTLFTAAQVAIATGAPFAGRPTERGRVLVLCGENADDYNTHLIATMVDMGLQPDDLDNILVIPLRFDIEREMAAVSREVEAFGDLTAVFVDTSAAYFFGADDNSNADQYAHASKLRTLATLPGKPLVIVLCHPIKNPSKDNLLPRGGGAFLNEVDANLTVWKDDGADVFSLHWAGKMRGPNFDPLRFELHRVEVPAYTDRRGRPLVSTAARFVPEERAEQLAEKAVDDQDVLLRTMLHNPKASVRTLAMKAGWTNGMGQPLKTRVERRLETLERHTLAARDRRGTWFLTPKGQKEAEVLR